MPINRSLASLPSAANPAGKVAMAEGGLPEKRSLH